MASFSTSSSRLASATASTSRIRINEIAQDTRAPSSSQRRLSTSATPSRSMRSTWQPPTWLLPSSAYQPQRYFSSTPFPSRRCSSNPSSSSSPSSKSSYTFPTHSNPTPYEIFHFTSTRSVTPSEVKLRYYDLVRSLHPDRLTSSTTSPSSKSKQKAQEEFKLVVQAYNLLKDPKKKHLYDRAGLGWDSTKGETTSSAFGAGSDPWRNWQDMRYTRRYNPGFSGPAHDQFGWQNQGFYSNQYNPHGSTAYSNGWNGGNGKYTTNGIFISSLFVITWVLAGFQYSRLSLQSQKSIERADRSHMDAARSLNEARELARSEEGRERWKAFRRRAREQKVIEELEGGAGGGGHGRMLALEAPKESGGVNGYEESPYGVGHGGPSGKEAAQERFARAQAAQQAQIGTLVQ